MQRKIHYGTNPNELCHRKRTGMAYANSRGSGEPAHSRSLARTYAVRSRERWVSGRFQPKNWICGLAKGPGMRTERLL